MELQTTSAMLLKSIFLAVIFSLSDGEESCQPFINSFRGTSLVSNETTDIKEVVFMSSTGPFQERQICKMHCQNGRWTGPFCSKDSETEHSKAFCLIQKIPLNARTFYLNESINLTPNMEMESETELSFHCAIHGRYKLVGDRTVVCKDGKWQGKFPDCLQTNYFYNFKGDIHPPAIEFQVAGGVGELNNRGTLILLPKSILHLNCLFPRFSGTPKWQWSANYRKYPTGWALSLKERDLHFRLSIYYADVRDSGTFSCISPLGQTNVVHVQVEDVKCPDMLVDDGLRIVTGRSTSLGATWNFTCPLGYHIRGPTSMKCLPEGHWSGKLPSCDIVRCPQPKLGGEHLIELSVDIFFAGRAEYACPKGFQLIGSSILTCKVDGTWSSTPPTCKEIICPEMKPPHHGRVQIVGERRVDSTTVFSCHKRFLPYRKIVSFCESNGQWSNPPPICRHACQHPGRPLNGKLIPKRSLYEIGFIALISCDPGFRPAGPDRLKCLATKKWSSPLTPCVQSLG